RPGGWPRQGLAPSCRRIRACAPPTSASTARTALSARGPHARLGHLAMTMWQPELESLERAPLERLIVERMRATLARVLAEPAWARRLSGVRPEQITRVEDWRTLPFLTKDDLRDAYPYGLACSRAAGYRRIQM